MSLLQLSFLYLPEPKERFLTALLKEIELRPEYLQGEQVETIYFGGGTPSLLEKEELQSILTSLHTHYTVSNDAEITLEANPDDISEPTLLHWQQAGINRLSMGVQSFLKKTCNG
ncbi:radical SAM protein [Paraflavitalea speifideaquila]|uniref:radical SAM protein n=1 Tax=Paraflavitalea speifideaquila TaxID=3076558 RepID=UPI0028E47C86|nr:radical SAM protein [Paraflavitalea speifideiaquila]